MQEEMSYWVKHIRKTFNGDAVYIIPEIRLSAIMNIGISFNLCCIEHDCTIEFVPVKNEYYWNSKYMYNCFITINVR